MNHPIPKSADQAFIEMTKAQLRAYIDCCHRDRVYDADFEAACRVFNDKHRDAVTQDAEFQAALQSYHHGNGSSRGVAAAAISALQRAERAAQ